MLQGSWHAQHTQVQCISAAYKRLHCIEQCSLLLELSLHVWVGTYVGARVLTCAASVCSSCVSLVNTPIASKAPLLS
jgi:hypothetical protein